MSDFKDYPLQQLYGNCGQGPQDPTKINWTSVAIYGGIAIGTALVFALVITHSMEVQTRQWRLHSEKMNQQYIDTIERQGTTIRMLTAHVSIDAAQQGWEKEVQEENSIKG
jgi:hypothetical protein